MSSQEEWAPWMAAVHGVCSPWSLLCAPVKWPRHTRGSASTASRRGSETGYLSPSHVWDESFNSLHPFLWTVRGGEIHQCQRDFLETNSRALEAIREWFSEGSVVSVPESSGSRGPNPPSTWLLPVPGPLPTSTCWQPTHFFCPDEESLFLGVFGHLVWSSWQQVPSLILSFTYPSIQQCLVTSWGLGSDEEGQRWSQEPLWFRQVLTPWCSHIALQGARLLSHLLISEFPSFPGRT